MNQNETPKYEAMRARFEEIFSKVFAKPEQKKSRNLKLRAAPPPKETGLGDAGQSR
jgi:hypothetical protein